MKISALLGLCLTCVSAFGATVEVIPRGRPFRLTFADPREIRMALAFQGDSRLTASVGNYFSLVEWQPETEEGWRTHVGLEGAGYFTMRQIESRFPLETTDGLIGVYAESERGPWQGQLRLTHISAHLSDGSQDTPIIYSRETLIGKVGWTPTPSSQLYGAVHLLVHTIPDLPRLGFQLGGAYFLEGFDHLVLPYVATDLKFRRDNEFDPSWSLQLGLALNNPPEAYRSFRFFYSYYTGADPRGQFYFKPYTVHSVGIEMQI